MEFQVNYITSHTILQATIKLGPQSLIRAGNPL